MKFTAVVLTGTVCGALFAAEIQPLGTMDGFYRRTAVLGPMLEHGHQVMEIPAWMLETDFPYCKKTTEKEIPFADGLSVVRLLSAGKKAEHAGGSDGNADLAVRGAGGSLQYQWDILKARLDPYIELGYHDLTLVMDNIPWAFPDAPVIAEYGQIAPPADYEEWYGFIKAMCVELKRLYGEEIVSRFRFRMGTEMQDERRWIGGFDGYVQYYHSAAKAVKEIIPAAGFGPFNRSNPVKKGVTMDEAETVSMVQLAEYCAENKLPFDFFARSFYYFSSSPRAGVFGNIHPDQRVPELKALWDRIEKTTGKFSREVHEFGPHLSTEEGLYGMDTGARGAAQIFDTLLALRNAGVQRVWHWQVAEPVGQGQYLWYSISWLYSVFDRMTGGETFELPVTAGGKNRCHSMLSVKEDSMILVVSCWNIDRVENSPEKLSITIPAAVLPEKVKDVQMLSFTEENSVYDVLRRDLAANNLLSEKHLKHRGTPATSALENGYDCMVSDRTAGREFISGNWDKYELLMKNALMLKPFNGKLCEQSGVTVSFDAVNPSVTVLVFSFDRSE